VVEQGCFPLLNQGQLPVLATSLTLLDLLRDSTDKEAWDLVVRLYQPFLLTWARRQGF
jgi:hypothetical protein